MKTILNKVLLCYANTLCIEYIDKYTACIKFQERSNKKELEDKLSKVYLWDWDYKFDYIGFGNEDFNSNGLETTAIVRLKSNSKPFYINKGEAWSRPELDFKKIVLSNRAKARAINKNGQVEIHVLFTILGKGVSEEDAFRNAHMNMFPIYWSEVIQPPFIE